ncbi:hypothetical protein LY78DRAFT_572603, partial [Colletotrichum sublineola]
PLSRSSFRPNAISTHPSQIGYLTTSSPIVQATHLPEPQAQILDGQLPEIASARSTTNNSAKRTQSVESTDSSLRSKRSFTSLVPPKKNTTRSPSPVGRLKGVFSKSKKTPSAATSPERSAGSDDTTDDGRDTRRTRDRGRASASASTSDLISTSTVLTKPSLDRPSTPQPNATNDAGAPRVKSATHSPERRRSRASTTTSRIDTSFVPQTPPNPDTNTPVIVNTPPTPTDHSAPFAQSPPGPPPKPTIEAPTASGNTNGGSSAGNMIAHRRGRSGSGSIGPSKLSNITLAPLTPTPENTAASNPGTPSGAGFFSSVFSAAQNAATSLSSTIQNTGIGPPPSKNKNFAKPPDIKIDEEPEVEPPPPSTTGSTMDKEPAVKTIGSGELSLSQLGITDTGSASGTPITAKFPESAEARVRSDSAPTDTAYAAATRDLGVDDGRQATRPQSLYEPGSGGDRTPPQGSIHEDRLTGVQRSGSIRSAIGRHRKRGSSAVSGGTATTIGAAIAAANASVAHPQANASVPKLTGFAVASKKRNRDFHTLFKSVPDDDYLIEDYSCALQREILAHGRLYVSEGHLCFSSNILGWSTTLVMSFDEIVSVEKRSTALVFKNGLMISTLHAKHIFASFTSRDSTYDLIVNIWKLGHPTLRSSLNGVQLEGTGGDKTEKVDGNDAVVPEIDDGSLSGTDEDSESGDDDVYDEDDDADDLQDVTQLSEVNAEPEGSKTVSRKVSGAGANSAVADVVKDAVGVPSGGDDFPGPAAHAPTDCGDADTHYERVVGDDVIPAPLGKVYNLLFGPASVTWMTKWLTVEAKCTELQMEDKKGLTLENRSRYFTYIKPLNGAIGPKQTKCLVTETLDNLDFEKAINLSVTTQTPDVPSGNIFSVKTKYCLTWAENNSTRVQSNCTIEWTGKSWLKGPIEKGANDGQIQYCKDLFASLKSAVSSKARSGGGTSGGPGQKGKKKGKKSKAAGSSTDAEDEQVRPRNIPKKDWGPLEPVRGILEPILDITKPLMAGNMMYGLLIGLLIATWFGFGLPGRQTSGDMRMYGYPERLAAYDEMWRREESELWEWLEERVGLERLHEGKLPTRKMAIEPSTVEERIREDRMGEREIEEAIKVTEEKLKVLKGVMDKKKPLAG